MFVFDKIKLKIKNLILKFLPNVLFYLNNSENLPPPLTKEEEAGIIKKIVSGELEDRSVLIVHNLRLVIYIARKFEYINHNIEDLISIGTVGLIKAVRTFSPERNIKLATYASRCIENEILMYLRKISNLSRETSLNEPFSVDRDGNEFYLSDVLGTNPDATSRDVENKSESDLVLKIIDDLSENERAIIRARYCGEDEFTQKQIADMLGISQSYVSRLEKKIIFKINKEFKKSQRSR
ncbi:MAG: RNA polymerase sporulation sigma factor SigE [Candidatus Improbicoccus pseudotrichonymphae]|uniref:RNA polymerase sigma factor n=1 Tax=Candidatus Improbicoccus pseudotrichonymphae TaxID=3033792 RepID=A0AA48HY81_9FIRM|nr:MAG: RNA polymerase sporulation sigma factor SigE [Candidatus Improbicoccus pseudotrichonymphae]